MQGNNVDDAFDSFEIDAMPTELDRRILAFELIAQGAEARAGQPYSVTIYVRQQGTVCEGGVVQETGTLEDVKALVLFRRFTTT